MLKTLKGPKPTRPYTVRYQIRSTQGELTTTHIVVVNATTPAAAKRAVSKLVVTQVAEPEARSLMDVSDNEVRPGDGEPLKIDLDTEEEDEEDEDVEDTFDESPKLVPGTIDLPGE
jgi:hypothetical protein